MPLLHQDSGSSMYLGHVYNQNNKKLVSRQIIFHIFWMYFQKVHADLVPLWIRRYPMIMAPSPPTFAAFVFQLRLAHAFMRLCMLPACIWDPERHAEDNSPIPPYLITTRVCAKMSTLNGSHKVTWYVQEESEKLKGKQWNHYCIPFNEIIWNNWIIGILFWFSL